MARIRNENSPSRQALLDAAIALMIERGTIEVSLSEIGERAQLNSALVKYYFGGKRGLLTAMVDDIVKKGIAQMSGLLDMKLSPAEKLKIHIKGVIRLYFRYPFINRLIHSMLEDPEQSKHVAKTISIPLATTQMALLKEGIDCGDFKDIDPMMFYFQVIGACEQIFFAKNTLKYAFGVQEIDDSLQRNYANALVKLVLGGLEVERSDIAAPAVIPE
jgi:TetR/AcrR family transcriptional regulator